MSKQEAINHSSENGNGISKTKEFVKHHGKRLMGALAITGAMAATEVNAQNTATIDPKYYSMSNPYIVPNLPDRSTINVIIKTGAATPIKIDGMDAGSTVNTSDPSGNDIPVVNDELILNKPGTRGRLYKENGVLKITGIQVNYQADIYDRTPGSATQGQRPETVWVDAGENATLSGGPNINPNGTADGGLYKWKTETGTTIDQGLTDSVKVAGKGTYILRTNDATQYATQDTISILEKPTIDGKAKTMNFPSTTSGVMYKIFKLGTVLGQDTTWTEIPSLAFTGDGNAKTVQLSDLGLYRLGAQRTPATPVEQNLSTLKVDFTNDVIDVSGNEATSFKQQNRELFRDTEVASILYSIDGKEIGTGISNHVSIPAVAPAGVYIVRYTENQQIKTKKIAIR